MQNQAVIISELTKITLESVTKQMDKSLAENLLKVNERVKERIPKNSDRK